MAIIRKNELKQMNDSELRNKLIALRMELMKLRSQSKAGATQNPGRIRIIKRTIAMILTRLNVKLNVKGVRKKA